MLAVAAEGGWGAGLEEAPAHPSAARLCDLGRSLGRVAGVSPLTSGRPGWAPPSAVAVLCQPTGLGLRCSDQGPRRSALSPGAAAASAPVNPFQVNQPQPLTLNQLRGSPILGSSASFGPGPGVEPVAVASVPSAASHPALGPSGPSLTPLGPAAVGMVGTMAVPPSAAQATGTTNPFLL